MWKLSAGRYRRPSHVDFGLPFTMLTKGFVSGANPDPHLDTLAMVVLTGVSGLCIRPGLNLT